MNRILQIILILIYGTAGVCLWMLLLDFSGVPYAADAAPYIAAFWLLLSFTAVWWLPILSLAEENVRKTIWEEDAWLAPLLHELNERSQIPVIPRLLILEDKAIDAFATGRNTVVLSRGIIATLNEGEIKAVLAHEYGHLKDKDTFMSNAFVFASYPFLYLYLYLYRIKLLLSKQKVKPINIEKFLLRKIVLLIIIIFIIVGFPISAAALSGMYIFFKLYPLLSKVVCILWSFMSRRVEYRQDEFAQSLGYGLSLKKALLKIDSLASQHPINRFSVLLQSHPLLADRIRRLEWLEGLRNNL